MSGASTVVLKSDLVLAQMYADDLDTIVHEFTPADRGYVLPLGLRQHLWHTFQYVVTPHKWGWVTVDALTLEDDEFD